MSTPEIVVTMGLAYGAYPDKLTAGAGRVMRTHAVRITADAWIPLCRVQPDSLVMNETPEQNDAAPTCKVCLRRDPRFAPRLPHQEDT